jgi:hypothetical protein
VERGDRHIERTGLELRRRAIDTWTDPWLLDGTSFERMADAHHEAASRRLLRLAEPDRAPRSGSTLAERLLHVAFMRWVRHRIERIIRTGYSPAEGRTSWDGKRTQRGVP